MVGSCPVLVRVGVNGSGEWAEAGIWNAQRPWGVGERLPSRGGGGQAPQGVPRLYGVEVWERNPSLLPKMEWGGGIPQAEVYRSRFPMLRCLLLHPGIQSPLEASPSFSEVPKCLSKNWLRIPFPRALHAATQWGCVKGSPTWLRVFDALGSTWKDVWGAGQGTLSPSWGSLPSCRPSWP